MNWWTRPLFHHVIQISNVDVYLYHYQNNKSLHCSLFIVDTSFFLSIESEDPRLLIVWPHFYRNISIILTLKSVKKSMVFYLFLKTKFLKIFGTHVSSMILYVFKFLLPTECTSNRHNMVVHVNLCACTMFKYYDK